MNKTPKAKGDVIVWVRKYRTYVLSAIIVFCLVVLLSIFIKIQPNNNKIHATINGKNIILEVADSQEEREKGLSYRSDLEDNQGMIFIFNKPQRECFWMKDMNFNLDILWFDAQKNMIHHEHNLSPSTYPNSFCASDTKYVIELNGGTIEKLGLGETAKLEL